MLTFWGANPGHTKETKEGEKGISTHLTLSEHREFKIIFIGVCKIKPYKGILIIASKGLYFEG